MEPVALISTDPDDIASIVDVEGITKGSAQVTEVDDLARVPENRPPDRIEVDGSNDLPGVLVDAVGPTLRSPAAQRSQIDQLTVLPENGVILATADVALSHDLALVIQSQSPAVPAKRAQVDHHSFLPEERVHLARGGLARSHHLTFLVDAIRITAASSEGP